jgi:hypothetical protein
MARICSGRLRSSLREQRTLAVSCGGSRWSLLFPALSALALGLGPLLGGALVETVSWRWLFWMNLPFCLLGVVLVLASTAEQRDQTAARRVDVAGVITVGLGLAAVVIALVEGKAWGWTSLATVGVFAAGVGLLAEFWLIEHRVRSPMVEFDLFRNGPYFGASVAGFSLVGSYWAVMFLQPQYLQTDLGNGALEAGVLILPVTAPMIAISPFGGRLIALIGVRALMTVGMALGTTGLVVLAQVDASSGYRLLLPGYLLFGIALGCVYAPDVDGGDDGHAADEGRHRGRRAGDDPHFGWCDHARRDRRRLSSRARRRPARHAG